MVGSFVSVFIIVVYLVAKKHLVVGWEGAAPGKGLVAIIILIMGAYGLFFFLVWYSEWNFMKAVQLMFSLLSVSRFLSWSFRYVQKSWGCDIKDIEEYCKEKDKAIQDHEDYEAYKDYKDFKDFRDYKDYKDFKDWKDYKDYKDWKDYKDYKNFESGRDRDVKKRGWDKVRPYQSVRLVVAMCGLIVGGLGANLAYQG